MGTASSKVMAQVQRLLTETVRDLDGYIETGGGVGLETARRRRADEVLELVAASGLRGRGGAGFPTGTKWRTIAEFASTEEGTPTVVNAAEGEPGTFKDRFLLRQNPYLVLEGALIAAWAVGSPRIVVATKAAFRIEIARLRRAVEEMRAAGWLDDIAVDVVGGPSEYLFGEETGLLEVIEGRPPFPRVTPPWRRGIDPLHPENAHSAAGVELATEGGSIAAPALVDNVETLANVPLILGKGVDWYRSVGTEDAPGTILCTVTGGTERHGVGEFELGTPVGEVIAALGGGPRPGRTIRFVLSGVANPPLEAALLDTPLSYRALAEAGSGLGSASFIVIDDSVAVRWVAAEVARFLSVESCGQCEPCKRDGLAIAGLLSESAEDDHDDDAGRVEELVRTVARGARCALARQTEAVVPGILAMAEGALGQPYEAPADVDAELMAIVPMVEIAGDHAVLDLSHRSKAYDWTYPDDVEARPVWPIQRLADQAVTIHPPHVTERPAQPMVVIDEWDGLGVVTALDRELRQSISRLEEADSESRAAARATLRDELCRHLDLLERIVFPLLDRVRLDGADVSAYPDEHARRAYALLSAGKPDDAAAVGHARKAVDEVQLRVVPLLREGLDQSQLRTVGSALELEADILGLTPSGTAATTGVAR